jgi:hypothetical protein
MLQNINNQNDNTEENKIDFDKLEFTRSNIESLGSKIVNMFDSDDNGLDLFSYVNCKNSDHDFIKRCHGVVFNNDKLILNSFPYTTEYTFKNDNIEIIEKIENEFDKCIFYDAYEGCLIRIFYFNNKWYASTNKKLNALKSNWSSKKSFGAFFIDALLYQLETNIEFRNILFSKEKIISDKNILDVFCESMLDKNKQYMFILLNNYENRIVSDPPENPTFFHVGTFINGELNMEKNDSLPIPFPERLKFNNMDEVYDYVNGIDYKNTQGVIVFTPNNIQYKILNEKYFELYNARGNEPSIKFRYLQVRMDKRNNEMLRYLYPKNVEDFEKYENYIFDSSKFIYKSYVDRYIKRIRTVVPTEEFNVMREAHSWYLEDRANHKINYEKIIEILNRQKATNLNKIIKRLKSDKNIVDGETDKVNTKPQYNHKRLLNTSIKKV